MQDATRRRGDVHFVRPVVDAGEARLAVHALERGVLGYPLGTEHLDRAVILFGQVPDAAYPLYLRAKIHTEQDEPEKAAAALTRAVSLQTDFGEAWSDLGQARKTLLDDAGAFAAFQRAVEVNPDNAISQYRLGAEYLPPFGS